jgi:hypothetical protein
MILFLKLANVKAHGSPGWLLVMVLPNLNWLKIAAFPLPHGRFLPSPMQRVLACLDHSSWSSK